MTANAPSRFGRLASSRARRHRCELRFASMATVAVGVLLAGLAWHHTPWRDELQAWAIARDAQTLPALFAQLRYEGHPALWYLVLWVPARAARSVIALQVIQWFVACAATFLLSWRAPFGRPTRVLIACSYLVLFEYGTVARSYGLMWLLVLVALCVLTTRNGLWLSAIALALVANTTVLAIPLALGLSIGIVADRRLLTTLRAPTAWRARLGAVSIVIVGIALALLTARPAADAAHSDVTLGFDRARATVDSAFTLRALAPFPSALPSFWETHALDRFGMGAALASCGVVATGMWFMRHRPAAWIPWLFTSVGVPTLLYTRGLTASLRFAGLGFVAAITALWCMRLVDARTRRTAWAATALGLVGCLATALVIPTVLLTPFSGAAATAQWIAHNAATHPIVCDTAARCSSVGIRLDRPTNAPDQPNPFTYARFTNANQADTDEAATQRALALAHNTAAPVVLLTTARPTGARITTTHRVADSIVADERYWISIVAP